MAEKSRYWLCTMYNENMIDNWQSVVEDLLQVPVSYCIHDKDKNADGSDKKPHTHFLLAYSNTTTEKCIKGLFEKLQAKDKNAFTPQGVVPCKNVKKSYDYLIHDTDKCKKEGKHLYEFDERVLLNDFCIDDYFSLSSGNERQIKLKILDLIVVEGFENMVDLYNYLVSSCDDTYIDVFLFVLWTF